MLVYFRCMFILNDSFHSNMHFILASIEYENSFLKVCNSTRSFKKKNLFAEQLFG